MTSIRITAGLLAFEKENCEDCTNKCALDDAAHNLGVSAPELRTIGEGVCPYHQNKGVIPRERHEKSVLHQSHMNNGVTLVQRITRLLSG